GRVAVVELELPAAADLGPVRDLDQVDLAAVGGAVDPAGADRRVRVPEPAGNPRRTLWDAGLGSDPVAERREALELGVRERPERGEVIVATEHVERYAPLVEGDQEAAEAVVERVDVVEQAEDVGLAPGEDLPAYADEDRPLLPVEVTGEEPVPDAGDAIQV